MASMLRTRFAGRIVGGLDQIASAKVLKACRTELGQFIVAKDIRNGRMFICCASFV
jgi:hypothetical protein